MALVGVIVVDLPNATTEKRVAFRTSLEHRGWYGHSIPFSYTKTFWESADEARARLHPLDPGSVDDWIAHGIHHLAADRDDAERISREHVELAAKNADLWTWEVLFVLGEEGLVRVLKSS